MVKNARSREPTMTHPDDAVTQFYLKHLKGSWQDRGVFTAQCPFCREKGVDPAGKLVVILNTDGFFHGYFRCLSRCTPGGFALWFAQVSGLDPTVVPGYDPDFDMARQLPEFPVANSNGEMAAFHDRLTDDLQIRFEQSGINSEVLAELQIGFNGRYVTYPYIQSDGNCYSLRCVFPDRADDYFWHGNEHFSVDPFRIFNVQDIERCTNGTLFLCEGEENMLVLKQLGYPGVAVAHHQIFDSLFPEQFAGVRTLFLVTRNSSESEIAARELASRIGYKVRLLRWPAGTPRHYCLSDLARENNKGLRQAVGKMIRSSTAFSPFATPEREYRRFLNLLAGRSEAEYSDLRTGFSRLDAALEGMHGLNVIGGAPKVGKSAFVIQAASQMAERGIPVLYYDFENGRQQVYQRILSRLSRLEVRRLTGQDLQEDERNRYDESCVKLRKMLQNFKVINDRKLTPELMRRHIDFIRHETRSEYTVVVIDSLHKLPFKEFNERRTGIDAWLRQLESIRDELQVSFLVISELSRGNDKAYSEKPHLGVFKGSGDIEYSADNAMVLFSEEPMGIAGQQSGSRSTLWVVASREHRPGPVATYSLDYPYWGFIEE
jgi:KaiC/GvpD/RAD55 family RecA-like ATPase